MLDLVMPEMDGFEFVEQVSRNPQWRTIPIIVLTAKDLTQEDRQRLNGYVEKCLQKGSNREMLLKEISNQVAGRLRKSVPIAN